MCRFTLISKALCSLWQVMDNSLAEQKNITLSIPSRHDHVCLVGLALQGLLVESVQNRQQLYLLELAVCEAVVNCIKHAYADSAEYIVQVQLTFYPAELICRVLDQGLALNQALLQEAELQEPCNGFELIECGRGLGLIKSVMDQVDYISQAGWNCLQMRKAFWEGGC